jgi:hypothetical protein
MKVELLYVPVAAVAREASQKLHRVAQQLGTGSRDA